MQKVSLNGAPRGEVSFPGRRSVKKKVGWGKNKIQNNVKIKKNMTGNLKQVFNNTDF